MKAYIMSACTAAIMAAFADNFVPQKWQKYVSLFTGAVLLITLISPILNLKNIDIPSLYPKADAVEEFDISDEVESVLVKNVEADIEERLLAEFNIKTTANAYLSVINEKIAGVRKIMLSCEEDDRITARLYEVYGCTDTEYKR